MFREQLARRAGDSCQLTSPQLDQLEAHYDLLCRWNRKLNLTRIEGLDEAVDRHYCESLFLATKLPQGPQRIADLGSGAGFPGIPVAIYRPDCSVTLIESHKRKAVFLKEASRALPNIRVVAERAEAVRCPYDWVLVRAVRWEEIKAVAQRLAPRAAVLSSERLTGATEVYLLPVGKGCLSLVTFDARVDVYQ